MQYMPCFEPDTKASREDFTLLRNHDLLAHHIVIQALRTTPIPSHTHYSIPAIRHCLRRLVSRGPISGLALRFPSGRFPPIIPIEGNIGPGLEYPPPIGIDIAYAGVLYGLTPVVISATLGNIWPPLPIPIPPPPIAANANPSLGLVGGTDRGVLSLLAAIVRVEPPPLCLPLEVPCAVGGLLYRPGGSPGPGPGPGPLLMMLDWDWLCEWPCDGDERCPDDGTSVETLDNENGTTPARRAMSASPSCQCIASAARQGTAISSATLDHISGLNLNFISCLLKVEGENKALGFPVNRGSTSRTALRACSCVLRPIRFFAPDNSGSEVGS